MKAWQWRRIKQLDVLRTDKQLMAQLLTQLICGVIEWLHQMATAGTGHALGRWEVANIVLAGESLKDRNIRINMSWQDFSGREVFVHAPGHSSGATREDEWKSLIQKRHGIELCQTI